MNCADVIKKIGMFSTKSELGTVTIHMSQVEFDTMLASLEKQIPKPVNNRSHAWMYLGEWIYTGNCPNCGSILVSDIHPKGCPYCIRAIDWGKEDG